jgi:DNA repair protein RecN (Recombination protein N)
MIKSLLVKNFALVEEQKIEFYNNYSAFTGETGAGKSVLFEAIDFLLGKKGDVKSIRFGAEKAIVEGEFLWEGEKLNSIFEENKIDFEFPVIIRREINSKGRSRAFINDTPITLSIIKNLAELYLDIHTQHEILDLLKPSNQLSYLDDFCGNQSDLKSFRTLFYENESLKKQLHTLKEKRQKL